MATTSEAPSLAHTGCGLPSSPKYRGLRQERDGAGDSKVLGVWPPIFPSCPYPASTASSQCGSPLTSFNLICLEGSFVCLCYLLLSPACLLPNTWP